jgi:hypothetical protein
MDQKLYSDDIWCRNPDCSKNPDLSEPFIPSTCHEYAAEYNGYDDHGPELPAPKRRRPVELVFTIANTMLGSSLLVC